VQEHQIDVGVGCHLATTEAAMGDERHPAFDKPPSGRLEALENRVVDIEHHSLEEVGAEVADLRARCAAVVPGGHLLPRLGHAGGGPLDHRAEGWPAPAGDRSAAR